MKMHIVNRLLLLCGASLLLVGCPGSEPIPELIPTPTPEPPVVTPPEENGDNYIKFDGTTYEITYAGTKAVEYEDREILYFDTKDGEGVAFGLCLDKDERSLTKSQTFIYAYDPPVYAFSPGDPGTSYYGEFYTKDGSIMVTSGSIEVEVSGESYTIEVDCVCEGNKELTIRYTGALSYSSSSGTSTIEVNDREFPYIMAFDQKPNKFEDSNLYTTEIWMLGYADRYGYKGSYLFSGITFVHSTPTLGAGIYNAISWLDTNPSYEDKTFIGDARVFEGDKFGFGGNIIAGKVNIAVEGDIYTMTFEDVVLMGGTESRPTYDMSGTYTGVLVDDVEMYIDPIWDDFIIGL
jgi:hypothetical protein